MIASLIWILLKSRQHFFFFILKYYYLLLILLLNLPSLVFKVYLEMKTLKILQNKIFKKSSFFRFI